jgi:COP9 signalosome complex subunit 4
VHSTTDKETLLQFKLCQARISDYGRKFLEAASRYHELSYVGDIDEEERRHML